MRQIREDLGSLILGKKVENHRRKKSRQGQQNWPPPSLPLAQGLVYYPVISVVGKLRLNLCLTHRLLH